MDTRFLAGFFVSVLFVFASASAADGVTHVWECEMEDSTTYDQLVEVTKRWADAARKIDGAGDLKVFLEFPYAGEEIGEFLFVMSTPDATTWGRFMDGYDGSGVEAVDEEWIELASCDEAVIFRSVSMQ